MKKYSQESQKHISGKTILKVKFAFKYTKYCLTARHRKGHGIHSPFVYNLVSKVFNDEEKYDEYGEINNLRNKLLNDNTMIQVNDYGAGSKASDSNNRKICDILRNASVRPAFGKLLYRLIKHFKPTTILELGTSLGFSTMYMSTGYPRSNITTIEGCPNIAAYATENFNQLNLKNITLHTGNFDTELPCILREKQTIDFAYIDGNHRKKPVISYFEQCLPYFHNDSVLIFDDIHWSEEMEQTWNQIKSNAKITATIDLFYWGIVFFRKEMQKQDFIIKF